MALVEIPTEIPVEAIETTETAEKAAPPTSAELLARLGNLNELAGTSITGFGSGSI